jgi:superfamily II DNA/RNA helicase
MEFKDIIDHEGILRALGELGFEKATPIQQQAIPAILADDDLLASAQTGTGKTAAFLIPTLIRLSNGQSNGGPRAVILVPTRELAMQLASETAKIGKHLKLTTVCIYGGVPYPVQNRQLSKRYDILIATPGRLIDHMEQGRIRLDQVEVLVLDEADRMLDMGFIEPVEEIASGMPAERQTLLFSATLGKNIRKLSARLLSNPVEIEATAEQKNFDLIEQRIQRAEGLDEKHRCLDEILGQEGIDQAIVFSATKIQAERIADRLRDGGHRAAALHGDMNQRQRTKTLQLLREGKIRILVATDVAARGIDVLTITHVINFDCPNTLEDYIHRIGRTGRAGGKGVALSLLSRKDHQMQRQIEKFSGVQVATIDGDDHSRGPRPSRSGPRRFGKPHRSGGGGGGFGRPGGRSGGRLGAGRSGFGGRPGGRPGRRRPAE